MALAFLFSDDLAALLSLVSSLICCSLMSKEQVILSRLSSIYIRVYELTCACALWQKGDKARGSGVVQMFLCGHSEYIAHASVMSMAARARVTDVPYKKHNNNNNNIWIASVQLVYVGLAQARPNKTTVNYADFK